MASFICSWIDFCHWISNLYKLVQVVFFISTWITFVKFESHWSRRNQNHGEIACFTFVFCIAGTLLWCKALAAWTKLWFKNNLPPRAHQMSDWDEFFKFYLRYDRPNVPLHQKWNFETFLDFWFDSSSPPSPPTKYNFSCRTLKLFGASALITSNSPAPPKIGPNHGDL